MRNTVLFDLDGTLTDPGLGITNSILYALEKMHFPKPPREELYPFIGPPLLDSFRKYYGFSDADAASLYLPVDPAADAPTVAAQERDPHSLLRFVRTLLALRHGEPDLQADAPFELLCADPDRPLIYRRGGLLLAINPSGEALSAEAPIEGRKPLFTFGDATLDGGRLTLDAQSFVILK